MLIHNHSLPSAPTAVILQLAGPLELAHAWNIIHRDVKPANILIKSAHVHARNASERPRS